MKTTDMKYGNRYFSNSNEREYKLSEPENKPIKSKKSILLPPT